MLTVPRKSLKRKKNGPPDSLEEEGKDFNSQLLIPFGMMYHCYKGGRGIHIRNSKLKNILLRADTSYSRMIDKCISKLYTSEERNTGQFDFYIADSRVVAIWNGNDKLTLDTGTEETRECDWTLGNYIKLSRIKFPSKAKFFYVKQEKEELVEDFNMPIEYSIEVSTLPTEECTNMNEFQSCQFY